MAFMFAESAFTGDTSKWDVSAVNDMSWMFYESLFTGDISKWDVSAVNDMSSMFEASSFTGDLCPWGLENSLCVNQFNMFGFSALSKVPYGCRESCRDGTLNYNEDYVDCNGDFHCSGGCETATCSDGEQNQDEAGFDCGGSTCAACETA
eukprot:644042-Rhodomonas_salina.1